ncbi:ABC transporter ATP-binding protein [Brucella sp. IR073]|uniref:ABC transporter ATP-binding protein n=1 Tax=unclassified Brucella TaxID=2632610 RepID=UPI003B9876F8
MSLLEVTGLRKRFGGIEAVRGLDLSIGEGQITGIIGPNGSGKTTLFNLITGLLPATEGRISTAGHRNILGLKPHAITRLGIARTFQNLRLFNGMSVLDNVLVGCSCRSKMSLAGVAFNLPSTRGEKRQLAEEAEALLAIFGDRLLASLSRPASSLSYANRRRLEIARALATRPRLLLLDEPAAGMNPTESRELMSEILHIRDRGVTIALIEHDLTVVRGICNRVIALDHGEKVAEGDFASVQCHPRVIGAYLGRGAVHA